MIWLNWVGEGRTGTTVLSGALGSRLDCKIGEEQAYVSKWYREQWSKDQILNHLEQSGAGRARALQGWPNLLEHGTLLAVGDKHPWGAVYDYTKRDAPETILKDFEKFIGMPVKTIVTVRHPLDNITAWVDSAKYKRIYADDMLRFRRMIRRYKRFYTAATKILQHTNYRIIVHEELCQNTSNTLQGLVNWIGLPIDENWLKEASARIHTTPHLRRNDVNWPKEYIDERIIPFIKECPLLEYYR